MSVTRRKLTITFCLVATIVLTEWSEIYVSRCPAQGEPKAPVDADVVALRQAIENWNRDVVKALLEKNPKLARMKDQFGELPLDVAAHMRFTNVGDLLIAAGAELDIYSASSLGRTKEVAAMLKEKPWLAKRPNKPLFPAAEHGRVEVVKLLLEYAADPNQDYGFDNVGNYTPLSEAVSEDRFEVAKILCEHGAKTQVAVDKLHGSLLHYCAGSCNARYLKLLLEHDADSNAVYRGATPLQLAAAFGAAEKIRILLDFHADINAATDDGATPLLFAAAMKHADCCDLLLSKGAKLDVYSACALGRTDAAIGMIKAEPKLIETPDRRFSRTPLYFAVQSGNVRLVELLLSHGAHVNDSCDGHTYRFGNVVDLPRVERRKRHSDADLTPLHEAASNGSKEIVRMLLDKGANPNAKDSTGVTPLHLACDKRRADVTKLLCDRGADPSAATSWGSTPLHEANGDPKCVGILLDAKADPNKSVGNYVPPLYDAAYFDHREAVELLLNHGAKVDLYTACLLGQTATVKKLLDEDPKLLEVCKKTRYGDLSPLMLAARGGHLDVVQLLVSRGAGYDPLKVPYPSPMVVAASMGRVDVVKWFLSKGVPADAHPPDRPSALISASRGAHPEVVRVLLQYKADPNFRDSIYSKSALDEVGSDSGTWQGEDPTPNSNAEWAKREALTAKCLIDGGASIEARNKYGETSLQIIADRRRTEVAAVLIANGADVNTRDYADRTPLWRAMHEDFIFSRSRQDAKPLIELLRLHGAKE